MFQSNGLFHLTNQRAGYKVCWPVKDFEMVENNYCCKFKVFFRITVCILQHGWSDADK
jgi:hypothetical protein